MLTMVVSVNTAGLASCTVIDDGAELFACQGTVREVMAACDEWLDGPEAKEMSGRYPAMGAR